MKADSRGDGYSVRAAALRNAFEELLDEVQAGERAWQLMDRIDRDIRLRGWRGERDEDGPA